MMNGSLLYELSLKDVLNEKLISDFKRYINLKYSIFSENQKTLIFSDALNKIIDNNLPNLNLHQKIKLRKILIQEAAKNNNFNINKADIFKSTLKLQEISHILVKEFGLWINSSLDTEIFQESLFQLLLFTKNKICISPEKNIEDILNEADSKLGCIKSKNKDFYIVSKNINMPINVNEPHVVEKDTCNILQNDMTIDNKIVEHKMTNFVDLLFCKLNNLKDIEFKKNDINNIFNNFNFFSYKFTSFKLRKKIKNSNLSHIIDILSFITKKFIDSKEKIYSLLYLSKEKLLSDLNEFIKTLNYKSKKLKTLFSNIKIGFKDISRLSIGAFFLGYITIFIFFQLLSLNEFKSYMALKTEKISMFEKIINFDTISLKNQNIIKSYSKPSKPESFLLNNNYYKISSTIKINATTFNLSDKELYKYNNFNIIKSVIANLENVTLGKKLILEFPEKYNYLNGIYSVDSIDNTLEKNSVKIFVGKKVINDIRFREYNSNFGTKKITAHLIAN
ncbi:MAG: hypothetical protein ABF289_01115 [Clostridiales bacterium]